MDVFIGRQPIFRPDLQVEAYELLFRAGAGSIEAGAAGDTDADAAQGDRATSRVVLNTFMEIGLDAVVGDHTAWLNLTRAFLMARSDLPFPRDRVVLEVLESVRVDDDLVEAVAELHAEGWSLALDDFVPGSDAERLLPYAFCVKLDVQDLPRDAFADAAEAARADGRTVVAEKIETHDELEWCREVGCDLFQGYFLCRPSVVRGRGIPAGRTAVLSLLARLHDPGADTGELEGIIVRDPGLSYRLLRLVNSVFYARPQKLETVRQALVMFGRRRVRVWATMLVLAAMDDKPDELMVTTLVRARMMEALAGAVAGSRAQVAFTVGLFSTLDAMTERPMAEALDDLPLSDEIVAAIRDEEGELGRMLRAVRAWESGTWREAGGLEALPDDIPAAHLQDAFLTAVAWAEQIRLEILPSAGADD